MPHQASVGEFHFDSLFNGCFAEGGAWPILKVSPYCGRHIVGLCGSVSMPLIGEIRRGVPQGRTPVRPLEQAAFVRSRLVYRGDYSTLMPTLVTVRFGPSNGVVTTAWISLPCWTTTISRFTNPPVLVSICAVPVQLLLTWYVPLPGVHSIAGGRPLATMWSTWVKLPSPS